MVSLVALWMPIVVSAVFVFLVSSVLHMVLKYHKADYASLPDEERQIAELRGLRPGYYVFPHCADMKEMGSPEMQAKYKRGPVGTLAIFDGPPAMPKLLGIWFVYCLLVSLFAAYLASRTLALGEPYLTVFRVVGATSFMAYGLANMVNSIWHGMPWGNTVRATFDGLVYALVTAGAFGWLWPH